jgi:hypothetical protein
MSTSRCTDHHLLQGGSSQSEPVNQTDTGAKERLMLLQMVCHAVNLFF